jgi:hypothetical protein
VPLLAKANIALLAAMSLHAADHIRQGVGELAPEVFWGGVALFVVAIATLPLTLRDSPRAPVAATFVGFWVAFGVIASHVLPHWSAFSDSYPQIGVDGWSWAAAMIEVAVAFVFGLLGMRALLQRPREPATR